MKLSVDFVSSQKSRCHFFNGCVNNENGLVIQAESTSVRRVGARLRSISTRNPFDSSDVKAFKKRATKPSTGASIISRSLTIDSVMM
jgi:hypothetical protein